MSKSYSARRQHHIRTTFKKYMRSPSRKSYKAFKRAFSRPMYK